MKSEFPNPFLRQAPQAESETAKSGIRLRREPAPTKLSLKELYVSPQEANAFIARRTQDLDARLQQAAPEDRSAIENELNSLRNFKRRIESEIETDGEQILVENPYFEGEIGLDHKHLTRQEAITILDQAKEERDRALEARAEIMDQMRNIDQKSAEASEYLQHVKELRTLKTGEALEDELEWAEESANWKGEQARKQKRELGMSEKLREVLEAVEDAEERVAKYEKIFDLVAQREKLAEKREAILKELHQVTSQYERAQKQVAEAHAAASRHAKNLASRRVNLREMEQDLQRTTRTPSDKEIFASDYQESLQNAIERDQKLEKPLRYAFTSARIADVTERRALLSGKEHRIRSAAGDRRHAMKEQARVEQIKSEFLQKEAARRERLFRRTEEDLAASRKQVEAERAEIDELEKQERLNKGLGQLTNKFGERQKQKAEELAKTLSTIDTQLKSVDERLDAIGDITEQVTPSIEPVEERTQKKSSKKSTRRAA